MHLVQEAKNLTTNETKSINTCSYKKYTIKKLFTIRYLTSYKQLIAFLLMKAFFLE